MNSDDGKRKGNAHNKEKGNRQQQNKDEEGMRKKKLRQIG